MNTEIWRGIEGYKGLYQVSNFGRIKNLKRNKTIAEVLNKRTGYMRVMLWKNSRSKTFLIHRLVAQAFIPNPENKREVNHIDGNKLNNCVENLEWVTPSENSKHAIDTGLAKVLRGVNNGNSKLTAEQVAEIRKIYIPRDKKFGINPLAEKFNVSEHTIYRVLHSETYK